MHPSTLADDLADLETAEEFLDYFGVPYEPAILQVNRLHILQRFHDYLARQAPNLPLSREARHAVCRLWLERAYRDFVESDARTEKVFRVFRYVPHPDGGHTAFVPLDKAFR